MGQYKTCGLSPSRTGAEGTGLGLTYCRAKSTPLDPVVSLDGAHDSMADARALDYILSTGFVFDKTGIAVPNNILEFAFGKAGNETRPNLRCTLACHAALHRCLPASSLTDTLCKTPTIQNTSFSRRRCGLPIPCMLMCAPARACQVSGR